MKQYNIQPLFELTNQVTKLIAILSVVSKDWKHPDPFILTRKRRERDASLFDASSVLQNVLNIDLGMLLMQLPYTLLGHGL